MFFRLFEFAFCLLQKKKQKEHPEMDLSLLQNEKSIPNKNWRYVVIVQVNEYPPGVGLSPHIDTHSAFEGSIFSLSLAGPCIMEFRRCLEGAWLANATSSIDMKDKNLDNCTSFLRRAIYMPPRSMLLLSGEGRYAWHHYIPHHKVFSLLFICSLITFTFFFFLLREGLGFVSAVAFSFFINYGL